MIGDAGSGDVGSPADLNAVVVRCPSEAPVLTPDVARALLRLLCAVAQSDADGASGRDRAA